MLYKVPAPDDEGVRRPHIVLGIVGRSNLYERQFSKLRFLPLQEPLREAVLKAEVLASTGTFAKCSSESEVLASTGTSTLGSSLS